MASKKLVRVTVEIDGEKFGMEYSMVKSDISDNINRQRVSEIALHATRSVTETLFQELL